MNEYDVTVTLKFTVWGKDAEEAEKNAYKRLKEEGQSRIYLGTHKVEVEEGWNLNRMRKEGVKLVSEWCDENDGTNCKMVYCPDYLQCPCGIDKNHVHCQHGKVTEVG
jgi:hypothetical protein